MMSYLSIILAFGLLAVVFGAEPTSEKCKEEEKLVQQCLKNLPRSYKLSNTGLILENKEYKDESQKCLDQLTCDRSKSAFKVQAVTQEIMEKFGEIASCAHNAYPKVKEMCARKTNASNKDCSNYEENVKCIEEDLAKTRFCSQPDIENFKTFSHLIVETCKATVEYQKAAQ
ncbi:DUF19 domain-containing protein [Caenorhabditis elegans]|uniref:DUF19 domain-containing protein n=1 Tax=Caenorhabditis elegans TaxID=6239 RepID=Q9TXS4_CAEEL|nr:DUF19 domain-containing protein [Caenorhabditis elegans]CCD62959.1 DUF19 domain-containing protein [Caenorhabditis elegans]|eukprot:NP_503932.2 Uncharacterized protein CELE_C17B7.12 [Caenorhabditis elegans]